MILSPHRPQKSSGTWTAFTVHFITAQHIPTWDSNVILLWNYVKVRVLKTSDSEVCVLTQVAMMNIQSLFLLYFSQM